MNAEARELDKVQEGAEAFDELVAESNLLHPKLTPIEKLMGLGLLAELYLNYRTNQLQSRFLPFVPDATWDDLPRQDYRGFIVAPQVKIGPYIADFVVLAFFEERARGVIECDGYDYHDNDLRQRQHDKSRDRWFQGRGFSTLRYTGSEIVRDYRASAIDALEIIKGHAS